MLSRYDDKVITFVLRERQTAFSRYLAGRLRHALIMGTTLDERNAKTVRWMFGGGAAIVAVFVFNALDIIFGFVPGGTSRGLNSDFFAQLAMATFLALMVFICHVVLVGLRNKEKVPVDLSIPPFDREAATSGGVWAAGAMGVIALLGYFFG